MFVPLTMADRITGLTAVHTTIAALLMRKCTDLMQSIEVSMFETLGQTVLCEHLDGKAFLPAIADSGYSRLPTPHRRPYRTLDGYIAARPYNDKQFHAFYAAIGCAGKLDDNPKLASLVARASNYHETYAPLAEIIATRITDEWLALCYAHEVPCACVSSIDDLLDDQHLAAVDFVQEVEHPTAGRIHQMRPSARWSTADVSISRTAPSVGEQSIEVLREAGLSPADVDDVLTSYLTVEGSADLLL